MNFLDEVFKKKKEQPKQTAGGGVRRIKEDGKDKKHQQQSKRPLTVVGGPLSKSTPNVSTKENQVPDYRELYAISNSQPYLAPERSRRFAKNASPAVEKTRARVKLPKDKSAVIKTSRPIELNHNNNEVHPDVVDARFVKRNDAFVNFYRGQPPKGEAAVQSQQQGDDLSRTSSITNLNEQKGGKGGGALAKTKKTASKDRLDKLPDKKNESKKAPRNNNKTEDDQLNVDGVEIESLQKQLSEMATEKTALSLQLGEQKNQMHVLHGEIGDLKKVHEKLNEENNLLRNRLKDVAHSPLSDTEKQQLLLESHRHHNSAPASIATNLIEDGTPTDVTACPTPDWDKQSSGNVSEISVACLQDKINQMQETHYSTNEELQATLQELTELQRQLTELQQDNEQLIEEKNLMFDSLCRQTERLNESKSELENLKQVLTREKEDNQYDAAQAEHEQKLVDLLKDVQEEREILLLKQEQLGNELEDAKTEIIRNAGIIEQLGERVKTLESALDAKHAEHKQLEHELVMAKDQSTSRQIELNRLTDLLENARTKINELEQDRALSDKSELDEILDNARKEKDSLESEVTHLKEQLARNRNETEKLKDQVSILQDECKVTRNNAKCTQSELEYKCEKLQSERAALNEQLSQLQDAASSLQLQVHGQLDDKRQLSSVLSETQKLLSEAERRNADVESELTEVRRLRKEENEEWERFQNDLLTSVRVANDFKTEAQQDLQKTIVENRAHREKVRQLEATIDKLRGQSVTNSSTTIDEIETFPRPDEVANVKLQEDPRCNVKTSEELKPKDDNLKLKSAAVSKRQPSHFIKKPKIFRNTKGYHVANLNPVGQEEDRFDGPAERAVTKDTAPKEAVVDNQKKVFHIIPKKKKDEDLVKKHLTAQEQKNLKSLIGLYEAIDPNIPEEDLTAEQKFIVKLKRTYDSNFEKTKRKPIANKPKTSLAISKPLLTSVFENPKLKQIVDDPTVRIIEDETQKQLYGVPGVFYPVNERKFDDICRSNIEFRYYDVEDTRNTVKSFKPTDSLTKSRSMNDLYMQDTDYVKMSNFELKRQLSDSSLVNFVSPANHLTSTRDYDDSFSDTSSENVEKPIPRSFQAPHQESAENLGETLEELYKRINPKLPDDQLSNEQIFVKKMKESMDEYGKKLTLKKEKKRNVKISSPTKESVWNNRKLASIIKDPNTKTIENNLDDTSSSPREKKSSMFVKIKSKVSKNELGNYYVYNHERHPIETPEQSVIGGPTFYVSQNRISNDSESSFVAKHKIQKITSIPPTETFNAYIKQKLATPEFEEEKNLEFPRTKSIEVQTDENLLSKGIDVRKSLLDIRKSEDNPQEKDSDGIESLKNRTSEPKEYVLKAVPEIKFCYYERSTETLLADRVEEIETATNVSRPFSPELPAFLSELKTTTCEEEEKLNLSLFETEDKKILEEETPSREIAPKQFKQNPDRKVPETDPSSRVSQISASSIKRKAELEIMYQLMKPSSKKDNLNKPPTSLTSNRENPDERRTKRNVYYEDITSFISDDTEINISAESPGVVIVEELKKEETTDPKNLESPMVVRPSFTREHSRVLSENDLGIKAKIASINFLNQERNIPSVISEGGNKENEDHLAQSQEDAVRKLSDEEFFEKAKRDSEKFLKEERNFSVILKSADVIKEDVAEVEKNPMERNITDTKSNVELTTTENEKDFQPPSTKPSDTDPFFKCKLDFMDMFLEHERRVSMIWEEYKRTRRDIRENKIDPVDFRGNRENEQLPSADPNRIDNKNVDDKRKSDEIFKELRKNISELNEYLFNNNTKINSMNFLNDKKDIIVEANKDEDNRKFDERSKLEDATTFDAVDSKNHIESERDLSEKTRDDDQEKSEDLLDQTMFDPRSISEKQNIPSNQNDDEEIIENKINQNNKKTVCVIRSKSNSTEEENPTSTDSNSNSKFEKQEGINEENLGDNKNLGEDLIKIQDFRDAIKNVYDYEPPRINNAQTDFTKTSDIIDREEDENDRRIEEKSKQNERSEKKNEKIPIEIEESRRVVQDVPRPKENVLTAEEKEFYTKTKTFLDEERKTSEGWKNPDDTDLLKYDFGINFAFEDQSPRASSTLQEDNFEDSSKQNDLIVIQNKNAQFILNEIENSYIYKRVQETNLTRNERNEDLFRRKTNEMNPVSTHIKRRSKKLRKPTGIGLNQQISQLFPDVENETEHPTEDTDSVIKIDENFFGLSAKGTEAKECATPTNSPNEEEDVLRKFEDRTSNSSLSRNCSIRSVSSNEDELVKNLSSKLDDEEIVLVRTLRRKYKEGRPKSDINEEDLKLIEKAKMQCLSPEFTEETVFFTARNEEYSYEKESSRLSEEEMELIRKVENQKLEMVEEKKSCKNEDVSFKSTEESVDMEDFLDRVSVPLRRKGPKVKKEEIERKVEEYEKRVSQNEEDARKSFGIQKIKNFNEDFTKEGVERFLIEEKKHFETQPKREDTLFGDSKENVDDIEDFHGRISVPLRRNDKIEKGEVEKETEDNEKKTTFRNEENIDDDIEDFLGRISVPLTRKDKIEKGGVEKETEGNEKKTTFQNEENIDDDIEDYLSRISVPLGRKDKIEKGGVEKETEDNEKKTTFRNEENIDDDIEDFLGRISVPSRRKDKIEKGGVEKETEGNEKKMMLQNKENIDDDIEDYLGRISVPLTRKDKIEKGEVEKETEDNEKKTTFRNEENIDDDIENFLDHISVPLRRKDKIEKREVEKETEDNEKKMTFRKEENIDNDIEGFLGRISVPLTRKDKIEKGGVEKEMEDNEKRLTFRNEENIEDVFGRISVPLTRKDKIEKGGVEKETEDNEKRMMFRNEEDVEESTENFEEGKKNDGVERFLIEEKKNVEAQPKIEDFLDRISVPLRKKDKTIKREETEKGLSFQNEDVRKSIGKVKTENFEEGDKNDGEVEELLIDDHISVPLRKKTKIKKEEVGKKIEGNDRKTFPDRKDDCEDKTETFAEGLTVESASMTNKSFEEKGPVWRDFSGNVLERKRVSRSEIGGRLSWRDARYGSGSSMSLDTKDVYEPIYANFAGLHPNRKSHEPRSVGQQKDPVPQPRSATPQSRWPLPEMTYDDAVKNNSFTGKMSENADDEEVARKLDVKKEDHDEKATVHSDADEELVKAEKLKGAKKKVVREQAATSSNNVNNVSEDPNKKTTTKSSSMEILYDSEPSNQVSTTSTDIMDQSYLNLFKSPEQVIYENLKEPVGAKEEKPELTSTFTLHYFKTGTVSSDESNNSNVPPQTEAVPNKVSFLRKKFEKKPEPAKFDGLSKMKADTNSDDSTNVNPVRSVPKTANLPKAVNTTTVGESGNSEVPQCSITENTSLENLRRNSRKSFENARSVFEPNVAAERPSSAAKVRSSRVIPSAVPEETAAEKQDLKRPSEHSDRDPRESE